MTQILIAVATLYGLVMLAVWLAQDRLVFPGKGRGKGAPLIVPDAVTVETRETPVGRLRTAIAQPPGQPHAVLLFFLGNFEDLRSGVGWATALARFGVVVVVQEYPGYGESGGEPGLASFRTAAEDAAEHARGIAARAGVPLWVGGTSLGTFSALHVAARAEVGRVLLFAPPGSLLELARARFWYLPVGILLRHRFDAFAEAEKVRGKVMVVHGDADAVVPLAMGERVCTALHGELVLASGCGHNDLLAASTGSLRERIAAFLTAR